MHNFIEEGFLLMVYVSSTDSLPTCFLFGGRLAGIYECTSCFCLCFPGHSF